MTRQVNSHSLADCLELDESKNLETPKYIVSNEVSDLISKIPNRVGPVEFQKWLVLEEKVMETLSA